MVSGGPVLGGTWSLRSAGPGAALTAPDASPSHLAGWCGTSPDCAAGGWGVEDQAL